MADLEVVAARTEQDRLDDIERALAQLLRTEPDDGNAITYIAITADDLALVAFALASLVALLVAVRLGGMP